MEWIGLIGLVLAIIAIIYLSFKGLSVIIAAPLATIIVILTNQMDLLGSFFGAENSYMVLLGEFIISTFALFLLGAVLAQYMEKSNATVSIANTILDAIGLERPYVALLALAIIATILTYGGISVFVVLFALVPMSRPIFQRLDINWELVRIPLSLGAATFTMSMLPGSPSVPNALAAESLGTGLAPAVDISLIGTVAVIAFGLVYMYIQLKRSLENGETFYSYLEKDSNLSADQQPKSLDVDENDMPGFWVAIAPLVVLILINIIFSDVENIIYISLTVGIVLAAILYRNYIDDHKDILNAGAAGSTTPALNTASAVAFGSTMASTTGFTMIQDLIARFISSPLLQMTVITAVLSGITGSSSGATGIALQNFAPGVIEAGYDPALVHRIITVASAALTSMPFSGPIITMQNISGLSLKTGYKHHAIVVMGGTIFALVIMLVASNFLY